MEEEGCYVVSGFEDGKQEVPKSKTNEIMRG